MDNDTGQSASAFSQRFLDELAGVLARVDVEPIDLLADRLARLRSDGGRVFIVGLGGSAANASHAACDLRGLANIEAYAPTDMAAAFTAAANDYGWRQAFAQWLKISRISASDALMVLSVGGGSEDPPVSENLIEAMQIARRAGAFVCGVVGPNGGETARTADICVRMPEPPGDLRTTHTEIFQSVVWHLLVTHPALNEITPRWESLTP